MESEQIWSVCGYYSSKRFQRIEDQVVREPADVSLKVLMFIAFYHLKYSMSVWGDGYLDIHRTITAGSFTSADN